MSQESDTPEELKIVLNPSPEGDDVYYPGSEVTGTVFVKVNMPQRYSSIGVNLVGKGHVKWIDYTTHSIPHNGISNFYVSTSDRYAEEFYTDLTETLWSRNDAPQGVLPAGRHSFPFRVVIPQGVASSHSSFTDKPAHIDPVGAGGCIRYTLTARVERNLPSQDHISNIPHITVKEISDISSPNLLRPFSRSIHKPAGYFYCTSGSITATLELQKTGFFVGEDIPYRLTVENGGSLNLEVSAILEERLIFHARFRKYKDEPVTRYTICNGPLRPQQATILTPEVQEFPIPLSIVAVSRSALIKQSFRLIVKIRRARAFFSLIKIVCPLTITNMPPTRYSTEVSPPQPQLGPPPSSAPSSASAPPPNASAPPPNAFVSPPKASSPRPNKSLNAFAPPPGASAQHAADPPSYKYATAQC